MNFREEGKILYYLFVAKKSINSLLFIIVHFSELKSIDYNEYANKERKIFFLNLRYIAEILDNNNIISKKELKQNANIETILKIIDKNIVHKDENYKIIKMDIENCIVEMMKSYYDIYNFLIENKILPNYFEKEFHPFDSILYRLINPLENAMYCENSYIFYISDNDNNCEKIFNIPEIVNDKDFKISEYGLKVSSGITEIERKNNIEEACILAQIEYNAPFYKVLIDLTKGEITNENNRN